MRQRKLSCLAACVWSESKYLVWICWDTYTWDGLKGYLGRKCAFGDMALICTHSSQVWRQAIWPSQEWSYFEELIKACSTCEGPYMLMILPHLYTTVVNFMWSLQAQGCMLHTLLALIICKNVFMKRLECLLHHHMTVYQHQATTVRKQKFEIINVKIQLKNWFFATIIFTGFEKEKTAH